MTTLLTPSATYKPFYFPSFVEKTVEHESMHWVETEADLREDVRQWKDGSITVEEKNHITSILRLFTHCYSEDTQIFTENGWEFFKNLSKETKVAQVNDDFTISFVKPTSYTNSFYSGPMYHFKDSFGYTDLLVTPNHKMTVTENGAWICFQADTIKFRQGVKTHRSVVKDGCWKELTAYDRLRVAFQADGCRIPNDITGEKLGYINHKFFFVKERKVKRLEGILKELGVVYTVEQKKNGTLIKVRLNEALDKDFRWVDLSKVSSEWCASFFDELKNWDGTQVWDDRYSYCNTNKVAFEKVMALLPLCGAHYHATVRQDNRSPLFSDVYSCSFNFSKSDTVDGQAIRRNSEVIDYTGDVFCVTVESGRLLVRRNYAISVCGNSDHVVENSYIDYFLPFFKNNEVRMALLSIASRESTHERAYALLNDTLGFPDSEYTAFLDIPEMKEKADFMVSGFGNDSYKEMAVSLAQTVCNEGLSLFSSFAMLLNYQRFGKMKGMCEIVEWSLKDEAHHCETMTMLFRYFVEEHPRIVNDELKASIYSMFEKAVKLEDAIIDVAFKDYFIKGLDKEDVKRYIRYIANRRLTGLGLKEIFAEKENPLDWLDWVVSGVDHKNFFEGRVTGYTVGGMSGEDYGDYTKLFQGKGA